MRTETITYKIYTFDELSTEAKKKALDQYRYSLVENSEWYETIIEDYVHILEEHGFIEPNIYFDLHNQGQGACFDCYTVDLETVLNKLVELEIYPAAKKVSKKEALRNLILSINILTRDYRNSYEGTRYIQLDIDEILDLDDTSKRRIGKVLDAFEKEVEALRIKLCVMIFRALNEEYDYLTSDIGITETFHNNETEFTSNGIIYNP